MPLKRGNNGEKPKKSKKLKKNSFSDTEFERQKDTNNKTDNKDNDFTRKDSHQKKTESSNSSSKKNTTPRKTKGVKNQ